MHLKRRNIRRLRCEPLEERRLLAAHLDANDDGRVSALDALEVINAIELADVEIRFDANGDGNVSAADAQTIINHLAKPTTDSFGLAAEAEQIPSASITLDSEIRQRDIAELTIHSIDDLDLNTIDQLRIDWGDGRVDEVSFAGLTAPITRFHTYFDQPSNRVVELSAIINDGSSVVLQSASISITANSPQVIHRAGEGLTATIHDSTDFSDAQPLVRLDPTIHFDFGTGTPDSRLPITSNDFSVRWQGDWTPRENGPHEFHLSVGPTDSATLFIDGQVIVSTSGASQTGTLTLAANQPVNIQVDYVAGTDRSNIKLLFESEGRFKTSLPSFDLTPLTPQSDLRSGLLAEQFVSTSGNSIDDFRVSPEFVQNAPADAADLTEFAYVNTAGVRAARMRGLVSPTVSGLYTFYLASGGEAELWMSQGPTSDTSQHIASVQAPTTVLGFGDASAGVSSPIYLVAGQDYYIETLHVHDDLLSQDHVSVGWIQPGESGVPTMAIDGSVLRPVVPQVKLFAEDSQTSELYAPGAPLRFSVVRDDDFGKDLQVAYTVGGDAVNGVDFATLSGTVVIPAGQSSAEISLTAIVDSIEEPSEYVVLRLVADPAYQLGSEYTRQVIGTIMAETAGGTELLPADPILLNSYNFYTANSPNSVVEFRETNESLPFVTGTTGNNAIRADVVSYTNPWDVVFSHRILPPDLSEGDKLFALVWARSANVDSSPATVTMRLQENDNYYGDQQTWSVPEDWTPLMWPVVADFNGNTTANRSIDIRLGHAQQTVELAGFSLLKLDPSTDMTSLPRSIYSYEGRRADATWRASADKGERIQRNHPVEVKIHDASGNPVEGAVIKIMPTSPSLPIGMSASPSRVILSDDPYSQTPDSARYRAILEDHFDALTDGGEAQWKSWIEDSQLPTDFLQWVVDRELPYHGHSIIWGEIDSFPAPDDLSSNYQQELLNNGTAAAEAWLENKIMDLIGQVGVNDQLVGPTEAFAGERSDTDQPKVTWWDVINHPIASDEIWDIVGNDFMIDVINAARTSVHTDTELIINEYDILSRPVGGQSDDFFNLLTWLDAQSSGGQAAYDAIGFQAHFASQRLPRIDDVLTELARYEALNRDFHITEFDIDALFVDEQTQADFTRDFYQAMASHEDVKLFTLWGFWAGDHWREDPANNRDEKAGLFNEDWSPRPNGQWLLDQIDIKTQSSTAITSANGLATFNSMSSSIRVQVMNPQGITYTYEAAADVMPTITLVVPDYVVNTSADVAATGIVVDGICDDGLGNCTLREAILEANDTPGVEAIFFDIAESESHTIDVVSTLPTIADSVIIDGSNRNNPITINGDQLAGAGNDGFRVLADDVTIRNLTIEEFPGDGIESVGVNNTLFDQLISRDNGRNGVRFTGVTNSTISNSQIGNNAFAGIQLGDPGSSNNRVASSLIGVFDDGTVSAAPNGTFGIQATGGNNIFENNTVSANVRTGISVATLSAGNNTLTGNRIGTDPSGTQPMGNGSYGVIFRSANNLIHEGNVISGNTRSGIVFSGVSATNNTFKGNFVGSDVDGVNVIANDGFGVHLVNAHNNQIGGPLPEDGNRIIGNIASGISLSSASSANTIQHNHIGINSTNMGHGNGGHGVNVHAGAFNNQVRDNWIASNTASQVSVTSTSTTNNTVAGNFIGFAPGFVAIPGGANGIFVNAEGNTFGGSLASDANFITGSTNGIQLSGVMATNNSVLGNRIGVDDTGDDHGVAFGVRLSAGAHDNQVGPNNVIAFSTSDAINNSSGGEGNRITQNITYGNAFGVDLGSNGVTANDPDDGDVGPNRLQNTAASLDIDITALTASDADVTIAWTVDSLAEHSTFPLTVEFFVADPLAAEIGIAQGIYLIGQTIYSGGTSTFNTTVDPSTLLTYQTLDGDLFGTATVTDSLGNTSEFALPILIDLNLPEGESLPRPTQLINPRTSFDPHDVSRDGIVSSLDALIIINALDSLKGQAEELSLPSDKAVLDVNRDGRISALDALSVINRINVHRVRAGNTIINTDDYSEELELLERLHDEALIHPRF